MIYIALVFLGHTVFNPNASFNLLLKDSRLRKISFEPK